MLKRVAIFSKETNAKTRLGVERLINEFCSRGVVVMLQTEHREFTECQSRGRITFFDDMAVEAVMPDLVLSVGGDGTYLETVMKIKDLGLPVAGVNTGRLGFLANIPAEEIGKSIELLINSRYEIIERSLLNITRPEGLFEGPFSQALNEITIQKGDLSMITITVFIDDRYLNTYWSDGLIISTATGSTAYNLSVGGPILSPADESIIISPIAPHNLTIRPIVISGNCKIRMVIEGRSKMFLATCDFRSTHVPFGHEVHIEKDRVKLKTVMPEGTDFYSTLRTKLMWGADTRN